MSSAQWCPECSLYELRVVREDDDWVIDCLACGWQEPHERPETEREVEEREEVVA